MRVVVIIVVVFLSSFSNIGFQIALVNAIDGVDGGNFGVKVDGKKRPVKHTPRGGAFNGDGESGSSGWKSESGGQVAGRTGFLSPMDPRRTMKSQITTMDQVKTSSHAAPRRPLETGRTTITCLS